MRLTRQFESPKPRTHQRHRCGEHGSSRSPAQHVYYDSIRVLFHDLPLIPDKHNENQQRRSQQTVDHGSPKQSGHRINPDKIYFNGRGRRQCQNQIKLLCLVRLFLESMLPAQIIGPLKKLRRSWNNYAQKSEPGA